MDIAIVGQSSLKIKTKNTSFIVNPEKKFDENIVIFTRPPEDYKDLADKIVFAGPGEYESSGVSIKAEAKEDGTSFDFFEEGQRLIVLPSVASAEKSDTEGASVIVAYMNGASADNILKITGDVIAVIGDEASLPKDSSSIKKIDKINLKKTEEYKGYLVHLSK